jgi:hypothetical protein
MGFAQTFPGVRCANPVNEAALRADEENLFAEQSFHCAITSVVAFAVGSPALVRSGLVRSARAQSRAA